MEKELRPFEKKIWLSSPTMHGDEIKYITEAYETFLINFKYVVLLY